MNILFVSNYYPSKEKPQFCIYLQQQAQALAALGHHIEVIVPSPSKNGRNQIISMSYGDLPVHYIHYFHLYKRIYSKLVFEKSIRFLEHSFPFDQCQVISLQTFDEYTLRIVTEIARKHSIKLLVHFHGLSIQYDHRLPILVKVLQRRGDGVLKKLISKADGIIGVSDKVCEQIREHYKNHPVFAVYNGVDTRLFYPLNRIRNQEFKIISIASLKRIKGNHYLLEAVSKLTKAYPDSNIKLYLIGRGPEEASLKTQTKEAGLQNQVIFIGYIHYEKVAAILRQCDVFAMPSYYEALGCAYLEAMASRLPVIGCNGQGIDEIIKDGYNGCLIEAHNTSMLYDKLEFLLLHPEESDRIAENGYQTVTNHYTWLDSGRSLIKVYQTLCKER